MAYLYANENFPLPVVEELRRLGHDVLTSHEAGNAGRAVPDEEVLAFSTTERRVLLTLDRRQFVRLHQTISTHAGIVVCTFDPDFAGQAERIQGSLTGGENWAGQLLRVNRPG